MMARILLFYTTISDQQKTMILVGVLGCIFYFLFSAGSPSGGGSSYSHRSARTDNYRTDTHQDSYPDRNQERTRDKTQKRYNDQSQPVYTDMHRDNHRDNNQYQDNSHNFNNNRHAQNHGSRTQNYGSQNYGFQGLSWGMWGAIIAGAYKLPPHFPGVLGPNYARPFFGMSVWNFTMVLNMLSNAMGGRRRGGGFGGGGGFSNFFPRRRY